MGTSNVQIFVYLDVMMKNDFQWLPWFINSSSKEGEYKYLHVLLINTLV